MPATRSPSTTRSARPFDAAPVRKARLAESVELLRRLLDGGRVTHTGPHYRLDGCRARARRAGARADPRRRQRSRRTRPRGRARRHGRVDDARPDARRRAAPRDPLGGRPPRRDRGAHPRRRGGGRDGSGAAGAGAAGGRHRRPRRVAREVVGAWRRADARRMRCHAVPRDRDARRDRRAPARLPRAVGDHLLQRPGRSTRSRPSSISFGAERVEAVGRAARARARRSGRAGRCGSRWRVSLSACSQRAP